MKRMITLTASASLALLLAAPAHARCASGNPLDLRCNPSDFLTPTMSNSYWWAQQSDTTRATMLFNCTHYHPGIAPPPVAWCRAAAAAQLARANR